METRNASTAWPLLAGLALFAACGSDDAPAQTADPAGSGDAAVPRAPSSDAGDDDALGCARIIDETCARYAACDARDGTVALTAALCSESRDRRMERCGPSLARATESAIAACIEATRALSCEQVCTQGQQVPAACRPLGFAPDRAITCASEAEKRALKTVIADARETASEASTAGRELQPVLLFADGAACFDPTLLVDTERAAAHRAEHPESWGKWRRTDAGFEVSRGDGSFHAAGSSTEHAPLAQGTKLAAVFRRAGTLSTGSSTVTVRIRERYALGDTGLVQHCKETTITPRGGPPTIEVEQGEYQLDAYRLRLTRTDGSTKALSFVYTAAEPERAWIDGAEYQRDAAQSAADTLRDRMPTSCM